MRVSFILPPPSLKIAGGYKIVYQYANYMVKNDIDVNIIYDCIGGQNNYMISPKVFYFIKKVISLVEPRWIILDKRVCKMPVFKVNDKNIPSADYVIATACETSIKVNCLNKSKGEKIYFIQDFENWNRTDNNVYETYKFNMKKIVVSKWLKEIVDKYSMNKAIYIPNGIGKSMFYINKKIENRYQYSISMLYHNDLRKRSAEGVKILAELKEKYPQLKVELFGSPSKPKNLPIFMNYTRNANEQQLNKIYNSTAIYVCTSSVEGYGLTGIESMCCGCALVTTACKGVLEYANDHENALSSSVDDLNALKRNLELLLNNNNLRINIANNGSKIIEKFSLENSEKKFLSSILN